MVVVNVLLNGYNGGNIMDDNKCNYIVKQLLVGRLFRWINVLAEEE